MKREDIVILFSIQNYLLALKENDKKIHRYNLQLQNVTENLEQCRIKINNNKQKLTQQELLIDKLELDLSTIEQELSNLKTKQLDVSSSQYVQLQSSIVTREQKKFQLEDEILNNLMILERDTHDVKIKNQELRVLIEKSNSEQKTIHANIDALQKESILINEKLLSLEPLVEDQKLLRSFKLLSGKTLPVIIECEKGNCITCKGCHMKFSGDLLQRINNDECELFTCDQCGRMIYLTNNC